MGFASQAGQVLLRTQTTQGVLAADLASAGVGIKLRSGALGPNRDLLIPDPEIGGGRDVSDAYLGAISWSGDYEFYARLEALPTLLAAALGTSASAAGTVAGSTDHTITPSDGALPYLSIEENIGGSLETFNYTDAVVNTLHLESDANGYLMGTVGLIGARQIAGVTKTPAPKWDNSPMIVGTNVALQYNGVSLPAKSFSIDINNNFESDDFRLGSFYIGDLTPKRREVTASFTIRESSSALWRQATYGLSTASQPGGLTQKQELIITAQTYEDIVGAPTAKGKLLIDIPKYILTPYALSASGDDVIEDSIDGQAVRPDPATPIMSAVITNARTDIA